MRRKKQRIFLKSNKKGNAFIEVLFIVLVLAVFFLVSLFGNKLSTDINTQIQQDSGIANETKENYEDFHDRHASLFDGLFITSVILLWIGSMIAGWNIETHPVFFAVMIFLLIFGFLTFMIIGNTVLEVSNSSDLLNTSNNFPISMWFWNNMIIIISIITSSILFVTYFGANK